MQGRSDSPTTSAGTTSKPPGARMRARHLHIAVVAVMLTVTACKKDPPPPPAPTGPTAEEIARARQDSINAANAARDRAAAAERDRLAQAERDRLASAQGGLRSALEAMVQFEYDEADITPDAERVLRDKVDILRANPSVRMRVEGHADERGSTEYNLALASRRAQAVKTFFTGFGLEDGRFETVSYGEERP